MSNGTDIVKLGSVALDVQLALELAACIVSLAFALRFFGLERNHLI